MTISLKYTTADLDLLPDIEGTRYEIIDGELYVTRARMLFTSTAGFRLVPRSTGGTTRLAQV